MADEGIAGADQGPTSSKSDQIHRGASTEVQAELDHAYIGQLEGADGFCRSTLYETEIGDLDSLTLTVAVPACYRVSCSSKRS